MPNEALDRGLQKLRQIAGGSGHLDDIREILEAMRAYDHLKPKVKADIDRLQGQIDALKAGRDSSLTTNNSEATNKSDTIEIDREVA